MGASDGAPDGYGSATATPACIDSDGVPAPPHRQEMPLEPLYSAAACLNKN